MIYLRIADQFDARALAKLRAASFVEIGVLPADAVATFVPTAAREFFGLFRHDGIVAWLACDGDEIVGSACAIFYDRLPYPEGSRHAELCGVYVAPGYRQRGLASELIRETIAASHGVGVRKTYLRPAGQTKNMYARLGFVPTDLMTLVAPSNAEARGLLAPAAWPAL